MKQLTVMVENKPGILAGIATLLGNAGINIESITAETFGEGAVIRIITRDAASSLDVLKQNGHKAFVNDILVVAVEDKPGQLGRVSMRLADGGVNIENIYLLSKKDDRQIFAMKVDSERAAKQVLGKAVLEKY